MIKKVAFMLILFQEGQFSLMPNNYVLVSFSLKEILSLHSNIINLNFHKYLQMLSQYTKFQVKSCKIDKLEHTDNF